MSQNEALTYTVSPSNDEVIMLTKSELEVIDY
jgi:hypothetical protein